MKYRIREFSPLWLITRAALPALAMAEIVIIFSLIGGAV